MKNKTQNLVIVFLTIVVILLCTLVSRSQVIGFGAQKVFMDLGPAQQTDNLNDTILRMYHRGRTHLYFVDARIVRQVILLSSYRAWREGRNIRTWYTPGDGWYYLGNAKCRITVFDGDKCLECRKPEVSVANMRKTKKK